MTHYPSRTDLPPLVPKRGNPLSRTLWKKIMHAQGWQITGEIPNLAKGLVIAAPHTSNHDGWYAFLTILSLGLNIQVMAKDTLFKPPFKPLLRWMNVIPVKRSSPAGLIEQMQQQFEQHDAMWIGISPEGTRAGSEKWKSGFYRIAMAAHVPIIMIGLDYQNKRIQFLGVFHPTGHYEKDLIEIQQYFYGLRAHHPERLSQPLRNKTP